MHGRMTRRRGTEYPGVGGTYFVPELVWRRSIAELRRYGEHRSEGLLFWGGVICPGGVQVTGLYVLGHEPQGGTVRVTREEARWLLRSLHTRDEKLVAQVHSHPSKAYHSPGDDTHATSYHAGFISIVVPNFARAVEKATDTAIYEFDGERFERLGPDAVQRRILVSPLVTVRRDPLASQPGPDEPTDQESADGWISTLVSSLRQRIIAPRRR